ncbi:MAG: hypothetical protein R2867_39660 [Caldilineaceae bacterium]
MQTDTVSFPNGQLITLPAATVAAIAQARARYHEPLWQFRAERVLKLGAHQWIYPQELTTTYTIHTLHSGGFSARLGSYSIAAGPAPRRPISTIAPPSPIIRDTWGVALYHWSMKIMIAIRHTGWLGADRAGNGNGRDFAIFVQFTLLDLFPPQPLPPAYI